MPKITKRSIDGANLPEKGDVFLWDSELRGFGVRIKSTGSRSFLVQYRNQGGRSRRLTLGAYGALTVDEARRLAQQALAAVAKGEDPAQDRETKRNAETVADLAERYITGYAVPQKKASSVQQDRRMLKDHILPAFRKLKIEAVTRADVARKIQDLKETPVLANRVRALLSTMFNLAERWGLRPDHSNPCFHVEKFKEVSKERFLSGDELARLGAALNGAEDRESPAAILAIRLLMFTGCRRDEILSLKWSYIDFERGVMNLPDSKSGKKTVPLGKPALDLLATAQRYELNPYVIPGEKPGQHLVNIQKPWNRIRTAAGLSDVRIHDLRHSFASVAVAGNLGLPIVGALLGHAQARTTEQYAHLAVDPLKAAADQIASTIAEAMNKTPEKKVIPIKGS